MQKRRLEPTSMKKFLFEFSYYFWGIRRLWIINGAQHLFYTVFYVRIPGKMQEINKLWDKVIFRPCLSLDKAANNEFLIKTSLKN